MTKEILYEAFCKTIAALVPETENPVNGDVEESYRTALQGILSHVYNKGIQDAVDATHVVNGYGDTLTPDEGDEYYIPDHQDVNGTYVSINKEEVLKLKI